MAIAGAWRRRGFGSRKRKRKKGGRRGRLGSAPLEAKNEWNRGRRTAPREQSIDTVPIFFICQLFPFHHANNYPSVKPGTLCTYSSLTVSDEVSHV